MLPVTSADQYAIVSGHLRFHLQISPPELTVDPRVAEPVSG
jgi:hypothetical protein